LPGSCLIDRAVTTDATPPASPAAATPPTFTLLGQHGGDTSVGPGDGTTVLIGIGPRLGVLNISDPRSPKVIGQSAPLPNRITYIAQEGQRAVVAFGDASFASDGTYGLAVIDLARLDPPSVLGCWITSMVASGVGIRGTVALYLMTGGRDELLAIDIAEPGTPRAC
jgi:hypothetical protein